MEIADALVLAFAADDPGPEWAEALADTPAAAEQLRFLMAAQRLSARVRAKFGG